MSRLLMTILVWTIPTLTLADAPRVKSLRTQKAGDVTYFQVTFDKPAGLIVPEVPALREGETALGLPIRRRLAEQPRLVSRDSKTRAVCFWLPLPGKQGET